MVGKKLHSKNLLKDGSLTSFKSWGGGGKNVWVLITHGSTWVLLSHSFYPETNKFEQLIFFTNIRWRPEVLGMDKDLSRKESPSFKRILSTIVSRLSFPYLSFNPHPDTTLQSNNRLPFSYCTCTPPLPPPPPQSAFSHTL